MKNIEKFLKGMKKMEGGFVAWEKFFFRQDGTVSATNIEFAYK